MEQNRIERAPTLGARLQKCADFVREGKKLADIGTDHGYVPVCLLQSGKIPFAVAVDVHKGPLESAMNNASRCGVADKMHFVCGDGLHEVLCAMDKHLVLQPMTTAMQLREGLAALGFTIDREEAVVDSDKIYSVMSVYYTDQKRDNLKLIDLYMGQIKPGSPFSARYAKSVRHNIENKIKGMRHGGADSSALEILLQMLLDLYGEEENA